MEKSDKIEAVNNRRRSSEHPIIIVHHLDSIPMGLKRSMTTTHSPKTNGKYSLSTSQQDKNFRRSSSLLQTPDIVTGLKHVHIDDRVTASLPNLTEEQYSPRVRGSAEFEAVLKEFHPPINEESRSAESSPRVKKKVVKKGTNPSLHAYSRNLSQGAMSPRVARKHPTSLHLPINSLTARRNSWGHTEKTTKPRLSKNILSPLAAEPLRKISSPARISPNNKTHE